MLFRHVGEQYAERIGLKAIFRAQKGRTTVADLQDGESIEMQGSGAKPYVAKNVGGMYSCTCPAWRNQSTAIERRTCKHLGVAGRGGGTPHDMSLHRDLLLIDFPEVKMATTRGGCHLRVHS